MAIASPVWELEWMVRLAQQQPDLVSQAVRRLLKEDQELQWAIIVSAYLDREINLGRAAELLGLHELELRERFTALGIPLRQGSADIAEAQAEVQAARNWFAPSQ